MDIFKQKPLVLTKFDLLHKICEYNGSINEGFQSVTFHFFGNAIAGYPILISKSENLNIVYLIEEAGGGKKIHHVDLNKVDHLTMDLNSTTASHFQKSIYAEYKEKTLFSKLDLNRKLKSLLENFGLSSEKSEIEFSKSEISKDDFISIDILLDELMISLKEIKSIDDEKALSKISGFKIKYNPEVELSVECVDSKICIGVSKSGILKNKQKELTHKLTVTL